MKAKCSTDNLCDSCGIKNLPKCIPDDVEFGDGLGGDNIISCQDYDEES